MNQKVSELEGALLDAAVAKAHGQPDSVVAEVRKFAGAFDSFAPSTRWDHGGPIIERERINVVSVRPGDWAASPKDQTYTGRQEGPTPLIAAMRAYVASKLGEEVEL